jgi:protein gp37
MGENTKIEWADHTFNPWIGCTKVSPACDHCYAEKLATARLGVGWGPHAERRRTAESTWRQPLAWNRKAQRDGKRARVFCASLADVFDNHPSILPAWRPALWDLIDATPHLDWLLLTKRPQNITAMLPHQRVMPNVWLGTTVENQAEADRRIPHLLAVPAARRFLSCEPLLGPVVLHDIRMETAAGSGMADPLAGTFYLPGCGSVNSVTLRNAPRIDWVIAGGESGPGARPSHPDWFRSLRDQCAAAGVPFFFKQWGDWAVASHENGFRGSGWMDQNDALWVGADGRVDKPSCTGLPEPYAMWRKGKKLAGALLDGREHREMPGSVHALASD